MNYKISKETCCKMCGKEIDLEDSYDKGLKIETASFDNVMKLSSIRMYDGDDFIECVERKEETFYFHPYCAETLLNKNHFDWLKKGMRSE